MSSPAVYTAHEVAELLGVHVRSVYRSVEGGDFPVPAIRVGLRVLFPRVAVDRLLGLEPPAETEAASPVVPLRRATAQ